MATDKLKRRTRIKNSIRNKISGTSERPRLQVYRSNKEIYAQLIDDIKGVTIISYSSQNLPKEAGTAKIEISKKVGSELAQRAIEKGIKAVVFDRSGYLYHGRVKSLAEGAREGGLNF